MEIPIPALDGFAVTAAAFVRLLLGIAALGVLATTTLR